MEQGVRTRMVNFSNIKKSTIKRLCIGIALAAVVAGGIWLIKTYKQNNYNYIFYNNCYYVVTNEPVEIEDLGEEIGEVMRNTSIKIFVQNENFDSNCLPNGASVYKLKFPQNFSNFAVLAIGKNENLYTIAREVR